MESRYFFILHGSVHNNRTRSSDNTGGNVSNKKCRTSSKALKLRLVRDSHLSCSVAFCRNVLLTLIASRSIHFTTFFFGKAKSTYHKKRIIYPFSCTLTILLPPVIDPDNCLFSVYFYLFIDAVITRDNNIKYNNVL